MRVFARCVQLFAALTAGLAVTPERDLVGVEEAHRYHWFNSKLCSVLKVAEDRKASRISFRTPKEATGYEPCQECMFLSGSLVLTTRTAIGNRYHWQPNCHFLEVIDGPKAAPIAHMLTVQSQAVQTGFRPCEACLLLSKVPGAAH